MINSINFNFRKGLFTILFPFKFNCLFNIIFSWLSTLLLMRSYIFFIEKRQHRWMIGWGSSNNFLLTLRAELLIRGKFTNLWLIFLMIPVHYFYCFQLLFYKYSSLIVYKYLATLFLNMIYIFSICRPYNFGNFLMIIKECLYYRKSIE